MNRCPFFGRCGGCKYDFAASDYRDKKISELRNLNATGDAVWIVPGTRRRADFCFADGAFGLFEAASKNIVPVRACANVVDEINNILPDIANLPWSGAGSCLITACDNGLDVCINANVPYFSSEFKNAVQKLPVIRVTWNGRIVHQTATPMVSFSGHSTEYPINAFLQPSVAGGDVLRQMVVDAASGAKKVADLFCGLGNFTFALNADGFDILGIGCNRDLFRHPLTPGMLRQYDCVVMDPPRAGAMAQCNELVKSDIRRVIYVSCNPDTFQRDARILTHGGYKITKLIPVDQFAGSRHWELFGVFDK